MPRFLLLRGALLSRLVLLGAAMSATFIGRGAAIAQPTPPSAPPDSLPSGSPAEPRPAPLRLPADIIPNRRPEEELPELPLPELPLPELPPVDQLLDNTGEANPPDGVTSGSEETFVISGIQLAGSTVFTAADFADLFAQYVGRPITFDDLLAVRSAVAQRYVEAGFVTSGAFIPPQTLADGVVTVQVVEGAIAEIQVVGTRRLNPRYIRSRLGLAAQPPIHTETLLAGLQRLQIDPLIDTVSADLQAGVRPGTSVLRVEVTEADSFAVAAGVDNRRSPSIGSLRRYLDIAEGNLFGVGDRASLSFSNTDGSNSLNLSYAVPVSPHNTRVTLAADISGSRVIDPAFDVLDISANAYRYEIGVTHPLIETPSQELFLGLALDYKENQTRLGLDNIGPFPLSPGADSEGKTRVSALRFSQGWTQRSQQQVLAVRSQFNLGLNWLNATDNPNDIPDSQFFFWRGQGQWVRLLSPDTLLLLRGDVQLATDELLSTEQFGLGGQQSVRGYRQDALLRDNGAVISAEARLPIIRWEDGSLLQITPFVEVGAAWNHADTPPGKQVLVGTGLGLLWQQGENFTARLDWGIPLVDIDSTSNSLQDNGLYLSVQYNLF